jgi:uncharacterized protein (UPF0264 family)
MNLLVSVRSAEEALAALDGGADLIDIKEPARGSLGRADDAALVEVLKAVAGRKPVSAACGELLENHAAPPCKLGEWHLRYLKWGLAGCGEREDWPALLEAAAGRSPFACRPVAVAYADWQRAKAPRPAEVCTFACAKRWGAFLLDTWRKDGRTLLDFLSLDEVAQFIERCRRADVPVALAGSLGCPQIETLLPLTPDWFAVRGAVCRKGNREDGIDAERVRELSRLINRRAVSDFLARASDC